MKFRDHVRQLPSLMPEPLFRRVTGRKRDVLFVWVPKCAGMSLYRVLVKCGCVEDRWLNPTKPFANRGMITFGHVSIPELVDRRVIAPHFLENAFKFAFVRNPFDRLVSLFCYLKKINCEEVPQAMSFDEFCRKVERREHPPVGLYNYKGLNQCNPMIEWLQDRRGRLLVDFVGRHESLHEDFQKICRIVGIDEHLPHENRTEHRHYRTYYTPNTRAIVERVYREDLDRFDYSF
jgi:chondroitin 4-sulfotransferase 11